MKSRIRSNKFFTYSRPYPSGFHAFKQSHETTSTDENLSNIKFPGTSSAPWNSQNCSWTLSSPPTGVMQFGGSPIHTVENMVQAPGSSSGLIPHTSLAKRKNDAYCPM